MIGGHWKFVERLQYLIANKPKVNRKIGGCAHEHFVEAKLIFKLYSTQTHIQSGLTKNPSETSLEERSRSLFYPSASFLYYWRGQCYLLVEIKYFWQGRDPARLGGDFRKQYRVQFLAAHLLEFFKKSVNRPKSLQIWSARLVMAKSVAKCCSQYFPLDVPDLSLPLCKVLMCTPLDLIRMNSSPSPVHGDLSHHW